MSNTEKPDNAEEIAKQAYGIYRGMKQPITDQHWDELTREQRGMFEWIVRFARLRGED
jgi:hypothetical protein